MWFFLFQLLVKQSVTAGSQYYITGRKKNHLSEEQMFELAL